MVISPNNNPIAKQAKKEKKRKKKKKKKGKTMIPRLQRERKSCYAMIVLPNQTLPYPRIYSVKKKKKKVSKTREGKKIKEKRREERKEESKR